MQSTRNPFVRLFGRRLRAVVKAVDPAGGARRATAEALESRTLLSVSASGFAEGKFGGNVARPTAMQFAPDGRLFVLEQAGPIRVISKDGALLERPFANIPTTDIGERGLMGIAFDPQFARDPYVYVYWSTLDPTPHNVVSRLTVDPFQPDVALPNSRVDLFHLSTLNDSTHHNGGAMHFGPDGKLYVAVGDNAFAPNAQSLANTEGKMLRLNRDGTIPSDNPFHGQTTGPARAIWALGLRNPFTFDVQPGMGKMFINDVGQNNFEEINVGQAGANYGWPTAEGPSSDPQFKNPLYAYNHSSGKAITGGAFYNPPASAGSRFPAGYGGDYFFCDIVGKFIKRIDLDNGNAVTTFATNIADPIDLKVGPDGSLYYLTLGETPENGRVGRIRYAVSQPPAIAEHPASHTATVGEAATFRVVASGTGPFGYQWQRDGQDIAGANAAALTLGATSLADNGGQYRCIVSNASGAVASDGATLTVTANRPPQPAIGAPIDGQRFTAGQAFDFAGGATDPEDGTLAATSLSWRVDYHTGSVTRPFVPQTAGADGAFTIPTETPFTAPDVFYRVLLTATDSGGRSATTFHDLRPVTATINLAATTPEGTALAGLSLTLDGQPHLAPAGIPGVVGLKRQLGAAATQTVNGVTYDFVSWSDGGAATHELFAPAGDATFTAVYKLRSGTAVTVGGLSATYFDNMDLTGASISRIDPNINFTWDYGSPHASIGSDTFSARWTGKLRADKSEHYTFEFDSNNGVRLWVGGELLIDQWAPLADAVYTGSKTLTAGQQYDVKVEYFENQFRANANLAWSSATTAKQVIPSSQFTTTKTTSGSESAKLAATADAYVRDGTSAATRFGTSGELQVKSNTTGQRREAFLKFDLTSVASIGKAKLRLFGKLIAPTNDTSVFYVGPYAVSSTTWSESTVTWNTKPARGTLLSRFNVENNIGRWYEWDITSYLRERKAAGVRTVSIGLAVSSYLGIATSYVSFNSREAASNRPEIVITPT